MTGLGLDAWWDEPDYEANAHISFSRRGSFILRKLREHDFVRFKTVMDDLSRDEPPDPMDISKFEWQTILAYLGQATRRSATSRCGWGGRGDEEASRAPRDFRPNPPLIRRSLHSPSLYLSFSRPRSPAASSDCFLVASRCFCRSASRRATAAFAFWTERWMVLAAACAIISGASNSTTPPSIRRLARAVFPMAPSVASGAGPSSSPSPS
jgi:hypothetical protein